MVMDRAGWLWRRKSSDKSPGGSDSSLSVSSHSEQCSDDQVQHHALIFISPEQFGCSYYFFTLLHDNVFGVHHILLKTVALFSCTTVDFPREEVS
jgi:hypothetical protein